MKNLHNRYKRFKEWEQQPHQVAPLSEDHHECATCGTHYEGNYCPRCGQSAKIGRYSFKNAILLYLDVWGLGNRGMFRSSRVMGRKNALSFVPIVTGSRRQVIDF